LIKQWSILALKDKTVRKNKKVIFETLQILLLGSKVVFYIALVFIVKKISIEIAHKKARIFIPCNIIFAQGDIAYNSENNPDYINWTNKY